MNIADCRIICTPGVPGELALMMDTIVASLAGQMDSPVAQDPEIQERLRQVAIDTNREMAEILGINQSAAVTCVKPSGNSSQLLNSSSGLHARWAPYYIRNIRVGAHTPVLKVLHDAGVPMDPENGQSRDEANTWVIHFFFDFFENFQLLFFGPFAFFHD